MKKGNDYKKELTKTKLRKRKSLNVNKRTIRKEPDPWKEIRLKLQPLGKAYNAFREKRKIAKLKEEQKKLREQEEQGVREAAAQKLQEQKERKLQKEKKLKEEEVRKFKAQEEQRLKEKRIKEEKEEKIKQNQIYKARLIKAEKERLDQLERVKKLREEEKELVEIRKLKIVNKLKKEANAKEEIDRLKLEHKFEEEAIRQQGNEGLTSERKLQEKDIRPPEEKNQLEVEQKLKNVEKINSQERIKFDEEKKKRLNGTVKWFSAAKGYGFIKREGEENDIFVHHSAVRSAGLKHLKEGEQLTFEVEKTDKGPAATNLEKTS